MSTVTKHLIIKGYVQGVGFRYSMVFAAKRLGLNGWVCNARDGSVEAVVQGPEEMVQEIITWAKEGPSSAQVEAVEVKDASGEFDSFIIKETV
ncbi:MAG: acylphosphatase [Elusimicrobia bacterium]|nr:acylphosphatase [Candidatus Obscuribacterium magneticum]